MIDNKTNHLALPLPHESNLLTEDVSRLREALAALDANAAQVETALDANAAQVETALDALGSQTGAGLAEVRAAALAAAKTAEWGSVSGKPTTFAPESHGHPWEKITDKPTTFTPAAHKGSHATGEADAITPASIGAASASALGSITADINKIKIETGVDAVLDLSKLHANKHFMTPGSFSFTVPSGVTELFVAVIGGGGSSGGSTLGGGGGGFCFARVVLASGTTVPITVGQFGGISSFGTYISCTSGNNGNTGAGADGGGGEPSTSGANVTVLRSHKGGTGGIGGGGGIGGAGGSVFGVSGGGGGYIPNATGGNGTASVRGGNGASFANGGNEQLPDVSGDIYLAFCAGLPVGYGGKGATSSEVATSGFFGGGGGGVGTTTPYCEGANGGFGCGGGGGKPGGKGGIGGGGGGGGSTMAGGNGAVLIFWRY